MTKERKDERKWRNSVERPKYGGVHAYSAHELVFITDPADKLYDKHVDEPIVLGGVLNTALHGVIQPIIVFVRKTTDGRKDEIITDGHTRAKRAAVIDHVVGAHKYDGPLKSVRAAIEAIENDADMLKRVMTLAPKGVKIPGVVRTEAKGMTEAKAFGLKVSAQVWRRGEDTVVVQADQAKRLAELGWATPDIAAEMNLSVASINRYLKLDTSKPREKKKRGKATRPSAKQVSDFADQVVAHTTPREKAILKWITKGGSGKELAELFLK
jgi:hypothetical protein